MGCPRLYFFLSLIWVLTVQPIDCQQEIPERIFNLPTSSSSLAPPEAEVIADAIEATPISESSEAVQQLEGTFCYYSAVLYYLISCYIDQKLQSHTSAHQSSARKGSESALVLNSTEAAQSTPSIKSVPDELFGRMVEPERKSLCWTCACLFHFSVVQAVPLAVCESVKVTVFSKLSGFPQKIVLFILQRLDRMRAFRRRSNVMKIPTFYAFPTTSQHISRQSAENCSVVILVCAIFGLIHCVGWSFAFPSTSEKILWRVCAIVITIVPVVAVALHLIASAFKLMKINTTVPWVYLVTLISLLFRLIILVYLLARLSLLGEAIIALRNLPPSAYEVVKWTVYLPHI